MRSCASRRRLSDNDIRYSASASVDGFRRVWRSSFAEGAIMERAEYHRHSRARMAETAKDASRHPAPDAPERIDHREALYPTRSSDVLPRIARERVPTVPHVAKTRLLETPIRQSADPPKRFPCRRPIFECNDVTIICETVQLGFFAEMKPIRPHSGSNPRLVCLTNFKISRSDK